MEPPIAKSKKKIDLYHSEEYVDNYFWLREKENPEVIKYLENENSYAQSMMEHTKELQDELYNELIKRTKEDDESVPEMLDNYFYYVRTEKGKDYEIYCRKKDSLEADEEIILDLNKVAEGKKYTRLGELDNSPNHNYIAYTIDHSGYENYILCIKNLETSEVNEILIKKLDSSIIWGNNSKSLYYQKLDDINKASFVFMNDNIHEYNIKDEKLIYEEKDITKSTFFVKSKDNKFIFITSSSKETSFVNFIDLEKDPSSINIFKKEVENVLYYVSHNNGYFYVLTNDNAINYQLLRVKSQNYLDFDKWEVFVSHDEKIYLNNLDMFNNFIVVYSRKNGMKNISIFNVKEEIWHDIEFEDPIYNLNGYKNNSDNPMFESTILRYEYSSLNNPSTVIDYDMNTKEKKVLKVDEINNFNKENYTVKLEFAKAQDGEEIPISIIFRNGLNLDNKTACILYGYGSYGYSTDPGFFSSIISLIDRNFVYAIAHIRGGSENGRKWYLNGKYLKKKNTFTDFIACAEHLFSAGYTNSEKLVIRGGSAGGLLIGAVLNINPQICKIAHLGVPFVDVINTMMDPTIPLTTLEYDEWGNPNEKEYFDYMLSYSPYDNLKKEIDFNYPNILVTAGLNDPRVHYWEPAKYVAKLRTLKKGPGNRLLFKINMGAGHGGKSGKYEYLKEIAFDYAFIIDTLNK